MEIHFELLIERPASEAFHHAGQAKSQLTWVGSLVEVNLNSEQPWGVGSCFEQIHEEGGVRQTLKGEVLEWEPSVRMQVRLEHSDFVLLSCTEFEDLGPRCRLIQTTAIELGTPKLRFAASMVRSVIESRMRDDYARLKAMLES